MEHDTSLIPGNASTRRAHCFQGLPPPRGISTRRVIDSLLKLVNIAILFYYRKLVNIAYCFTIQTTLQYCLTLLWYRQLDNIAILFYGTENWSILPYFFLLHIHLVNLATHVWQWGSGGLYKHV